jgi:hypothetical protein
MKIPRKPMRKPGKIKGETRQGILEFSIICFGKIPKSSTFKEQRLVSAQNRPA